MKYKVLLVLAILLLCACDDDDDDDPEIKIETFNKVNQYLNIPYVSVSVTSLVDDIEVQDIVVNRGNCKIENQRFASLNNGMKKIPKRLQYGEVVTLNFSGPCRASQVDVKTKNGSWSWSYQ